MAGKGRRTASRQAGLNRRRKKSVKGPSGIPATTTRVVDTEGQDPVAVSADVEDAEFDAQEEQQADGAQATGAPAPRAQRPSPVARRTPRGEFAGQGQSRLRGERPAAYLYVGAELRRIMMLTGAMLIALVVFGILL